MDNHIELFLPFLQKIAPLPGIFVGGELVDQIRHKFHFGPFTQTYMRVLLDFVEKA